MNISRNEYGGNGVVTSRINRVQVSLLLTKRMHNDAIVNNKDYAFTETKAISSSLFSKPGPLGALLILLRLTLM